MMCRPVYWYFLSAPRAPGLPRSLGNYTVKRSRSPVDPKRVFFPLQVWSITERNLFLPRAELRQLFLGDTTSVSQGTTAWDTPSEGQLCSFGAPAALWSLGSWSAAGSLGSGTHWQPLKKLTWHPCQFEICDQTLERVAVFTETISTDCMLGSGNTKRPDNLVLILKEP